ncbi:MAG: phosphotransferase family protein [Pseudomonadota bacterium]|nr:phosphotransferase family protein [Pseudomonadota bacterium]
MNEPGMVPESAQAREARLKAGLEAVFQAELSRPVSVSDLVITSAGARRGNVLFTATEPGGEGRRYCVTYLPTLDIELLPIPQEAALFHLAEAQGVPVPHVHFATEDPQWVGGPLFVSDCVVGETVPRRVLRKVAAEGTGEKIAAQLGSAFAALHSIDPTLAPPALARPEGSPVEDALARTDQQLRELLQPSPIFSYAQRWLETHAPPAGEGFAIVHGDVRNGNVIIDKQGLAAVLDWEVAKVGDPLEDLAWTCLRCWRFGEDDKEVGGFGDRAPFVTAYEAGGGTFDPERFHWWKVLGTYRWGLGLAGQAAAHLDGRFSNIVMAMSGRRVGELEYDLLSLLKP